MNTQKNVLKQNHPRRRVCRSGVSFWAVAVWLALLLVLASSAVAQESQLLWSEGIAGAPPPKDPNKHADKINEKVDKLHDNLEKFLNTAIASDEVFDANQIKFFKNEKDRSKKAKDRFHKEGGFKQVGRKNDFKNKKEWVKDSYDPNAFDGFEGAIDDLNNIVVDANTELSNANHAQAQFMVMLQSETPDKCQELVDASITLGVAASVVKGLAIAGETLYNSIDCFSEQSSFGFNASTAAAVFAVAAGALDMTATGLETADKFVASDLESACLNQIDDTTVTIHDMTEAIHDITEGTTEDVNDLAVAVDALTSALAELAQRIEDVNDLVNLRFSEQNKLLNERFDAVETLLNTPLGRRQDFPEK